MLLVQNLASISTIVRKVLKNSLLKDNIKEGGFFTDSVRYPPS